MTSLERLHQRNGAHQEAQSKMNTHFIFKGYPSIALTDLLDNEVQAAVVNQQEKDKAYIYTQLNQPLDMGSVWAAKGLHWLVAEEIVIIKDVNWHKYLAYLCNLEVEGTWGYFIGPEKHYVNIKNEYNTSLESLQKPVIVFPENVLGFSDIIVIKGRPWLVQEYDAISSPGLIYYSLRATTVSKEQIEQHEGEDVYIVRAEDPITPIIVTPTEVIGSDALKIGHAVDVTVETQGGYFHYDNPQLEVVKRSAQYVTFRLPFGVDRVTISIKHAGSIINKTYEALD